MKDIDSKRINNHRLKDLKEKEITIENSANANEIICSAEFTEGCKTSDNDKKE